MLYTVKLIMNSMELKIPFTGNSFAKARTAYIEAVSHEKGRVALMYCGDKAINQAPCGTSLDSIQIRSFER